MSLTERTASDLVVLIIAGTIAIMLIFSAVSILVLKLIHPEIDVDGLIRVETEILGVLTGAVVGFLGGRSIGRHEVEEQESG